MDEKVKNAWNRIKDTVDRADGDANITEIGDVEVIETALNEFSGEDKAFLRKVKSGAFTVIPAKVYHINTQELDELQEFTRIVIEKDVDIIQVKCFTKVEDYNVGFDKEQQLTQAELDLLKEVVENYGR